jgi:coenzyme F420-0:L-glutamate ligase / coenzyme F420-1:gamma-L-glutamate ligase
LVESRATSGLFRLNAQPLSGIPELVPDADLARLIVDAAKEAGIEQSGEDVLVIAQKAVSKVEGRLRDLNEVKPSDRARELGARLGKDPRVVHLILAESEEVVRAEHGVLITRTRHGYVCANAGIDSSNVPSETVSLLPVDPDGSARRLRAGLRRLLGKAPAVVVSDSFGRPWRVGQTDVAIGCAGFEPLDDRRGRPDAFGAELSATVLAVADDAASAAGLVRAKDGREAVVVVRGLDRYVTESDGPGAAALLRSREEDLFT